MRKAILDTSALLVLYELHLTEYISLIYEEIRIPDIVEYEFLHKQQNERFNFLIDLYNKQIYKKCTEYRSDVYDIFKTSLDAGESSVLAQNATLNGEYELIIDEKKARKRAADNNFKIKGILYIMAYIDIVLNLNTYNTWIEFLKNKNIGRFSEKIIKDAYNKALQDITQL